MLTAHDLARRLAVTVTTIRRWAASGVLPPGVRLGRRVLRWDETVINQWLASRDPATAEQKGVPDHVV